MRIIAFSINVDTILACLLACLPDTRLAVPKLDTATIALSDSTRTIAATIVLAIP